MNEQVEKLIDSGLYMDACNLVAEKFGITFKVEFLKNDFHFDDDKYTRDIYEVTLQRGNRKYTFNFGQSIVKSGYENREEPTLYDVLACLQKYDVGTFEDFCSEFGYDTYLKQSKITYNAVVTEYEEMCSLFNDSELETLSLIS